MVQKLDGKFSLFSSISLLISYNTKISKFGEFFFWKNRPGVGSDIHYR